MCTAYTWSNGRGLLDMLPHWYLNKIFRRYKNKRSFARDGMYKCTNLITLLKREWRGRILAEIFRVCFYAPENHILSATDMKIFTWDKCLEGHIFSKPGSEDVKIFRWHSSCFLISNLIKSIAIFVYNRSIHELEVLCSTNHHAIIL